MKISNWVVLQILLLISISCTQVEEISPDNTIEKEIILTFNQSAILSGESVTFEINDDFDFDNLTLLVNGNENTKTTFDVVATKNIEKVSLEVKLKGDAPSKTYNFSVNVKGQSSGLIETLNFKGEEGFAVTNYKKSKSPTEIIIFYILIVGLIIAVILGIYYILKRDNMPLGKKTFLNGNITFPNGELPSIRLEGQNRHYVDISKVLGIEPGIILEPVDRYYNRSKRRFARLKNTSNAENVIMYDGNEESMGVTQEIYHMDEIKIKTEDNRIIILGYMNNRNVRIN